MLQSTYVVRVLREIAAKGAWKATGNTKNSLWLGFDDPEIMWFLRRYEKKTGPAIEKLRADFAAAMKECVESKKTLLAFFPFTQPEAREMLKDINRKSGRVPTQPHEEPMPKGTKVHKMYDSMYQKGMSKGKAARVAQSKTGKSLKTGRSPGGK